MISIVIIVKNDRGIEDTLKNLINIKKPEKTEIIVIDASKKGVLKDIKNKFPKVRWFYYENETGKKITIPEQRNIGIKKAKGDIIVFIDANCIPDKNWLVNLTSLLIINKEEMVLGATKSRNKGNMHDMKIQKDYVDECPTINVAFKKEMISKVGFFDENFNYGSDIDFSWRIRDLGYRIGYSDNAKVSHDWGKNIDNIKRAKRYGEARVNLYLKHPNRLNNLINPSKDLFTLYSLIFFIYIISIIPFLFFNPLYSLLILIPFIKNIKKSPIRKMIFDFFWGYGVIKRTFEIIFKREKFF